MDRPQKDIMPFSGPERDPSLGFQVAILRAILHLVSVRPVPSSQTLLGIERLAYNSFSLLLQYILARPPLFLLAQSSILNSVVPYTCGIHVCCTHDLFASER